MEIHSAPHRLMMVLGSCSILHLLLRCHLLTLFLQSADGTANSSSGTSSNLSLDALAKAKKALQLKKELSAKLKRLPVSEAAAKKVFVDAKVAHYWDLAVNFSEDSS
ncbi:uncharacterized protein [Aegilops tauschii subsp. strangulata]|uniref:uncharacterized protein isoform X2 n=1 Tax=Aegilops tauschii subsp. strangulata TaxID=200361 RepID=UPI00098B66C6|nr:uncharacterized protein LOC109736564 isoform X2 [Aegilops tauschii subsp. strangulata]